MPRLAIGVVVGVAAGLLLALLESAWVVATCALYFDGAGEAVRLWLCVSGLGAAAGAVGGAAAGFVDTAVARWGGRGRAVVWAALAAPFVAAAAVQAFAGPRARTLPGRPLWILALAVAGVVAVFAAVEGAARALPRVRASRRSAVVATVVAGLALGALYAADQRVLPRLYPFFHRGLGVAAAAAAAAVVGVWAARRSRPRASLAVAIGVVALAAGAVAERHLVHARALRTLALERTVLAAPLVRLPRLTPAPPPAPSTATRATGPLPAGPRLGDRDVFLITVDAMRDDRLAAATAPTVSALAERGVRFTRAYAQVPHTSFSVATLLTGKYVYALATLGREAAAHQTLAEVLRRERYKTAAFYPPSVFYIDHERLRALEASAYGFEYVKYEFLPAPRRSEQLFTFLESEKPDRVFAWIDYLEPHEPYDLHPGVPPDGQPGAASARERYDGEVRFVDGEIARVVAYLERTRPHALVIVAADHGEEFGEHGGHYHGTTLYEEQLRVPLVFTALDGALAPARVGGAVGLVDVAPTVLSLLGIPASARMRGRDLGPFMAGAPPAALGPVFAEIDRKKMIVDGTDKLICDLETESCQLFDLAADAAEQHNLIESRAPLAAALRAQLDGWMAAETRFEDGHAGRAAALLERARQGDRAVALEMAALLGGADVAARREAARLLVELPVEPATRDALAAAAGGGDQLTAEWAVVGLARLGDAAARARLTGLVDAACANAETALCAHAALAAADPIALGRALALAHDDFTLAAPLVRALGRTHDPRAWEPLMVQLGEVRTRADVVAALGDLGDRRSLPTLVRWVAGEPYIGVRAAMVRLVAALGDAAERAGDHAAATAARDALVELGRGEQEALVVRALFDWLGPRRLGGVVDAAHASAGRPGGELWLSGDGDGAVEVTIAVERARATMAGGVAHLRPRRGGSASLRALDGKPQVRWAQWRPD